ncbi:MULTISPECIES: 2,3-dihydro-2,3-dihydroxybenzoate dehydrogenase [unclassified Streptomyces]|uniref:2,3-dihydro-2,3-dihydroxybenzoate dehydrogenase n=1 Tax=unclassified Streptomyces TaxID=2593676 RepID=UPI00081B92F9|nr:MULTISPECIES: 2,3-dihydro-2,3-dihydroxybenzoate dehydrogenase [unclassified Streptomyces]MYQ54600.1 2,3-dihydro-2,3-dihydroxybenzoate dehydrogenase [Streptomyces sp. SID4941]SCE25529.1 2,3-dihydro-2,3-dihydroxybenzoate dehydrogenase [Streptomyces sp. PalvLS-984]SDC90774.1 2,3-dihydro-2,3-dihydroxybenzoate dehydrogenase [Streptomyces sp. AmelKG-A3]
MKKTIALVTGAAGGIGSAVTRALAERGTAVAAVDRDPEPLEQVTGAFAAKGLDVTAFPADVTRADDVERAVAAVERRLGPVDHLVNAAGVLRTGEAVTLTDDDWNTTFAVNTAGVFHVSRAVVGRMARRGHGSVVTVASNAAGTPRTGMAAYAASKAAAMFTKCLGLEVARYGVRCNVVAPGSTDTPMLSSMWEDASGPRRTIEGIPESFKVGIPLGKLARPDDIADAVVFLLSDRASHITLHSLLVDGGASLGN